MRNGLLIYIVCILLSASEGYSQTAGGYAALTRTQAPIIQYIKAGKCLKEGGAIHLKGRYFSLTGNRSLILMADDGKQVKLSVSHWSEQSIIASLPLLSVVKPGSRYATVIINTDDQRVISNRDKSILICPEQKTVISGKAPKEYNRTIQTTDTSSDKYSMDSFSESATSPNSLPPGNGGTLIGSDAPQASGITGLKKRMNGNYEEAELMVISKNMDEARKLAAMVAGYGYRIKRRHVLKNIDIVISVIGIPKELKVDVVLQQLKQKDKSLLIDLNHRYQYAGSANTINTDNDRSLQLHNSIGWGKVNKNCGDGIKMGLIDSLVDTQHPDFRRNQIVNKSFLPFGVKLSDKQHATAIASILVGQPDSPVTGLLPAAKLYVAGVFRRKMEGRVDTTAELIIDGLDWLIGNDVYAINLSLAGPYNQLLDAAIKGILQKNVFIVAAVGNNGFKNVKMYPAAIKGVVGVTAIDIRDRVYNKANQGDFVQLSAPGVDILAAREGGKYAYVSGTSYASPYVIASLASLRKTYPKRTVKNIINTLYKQADDLGKTGKDSVFGWGRLNYKSCR